MTETKTDLNKHIAGIVLTSALLGLGLGQALAGIGMVIQMPVIGPDLGPDFGLSHAERLILAGVMVMTTVPFLIRTEYTELRETLAAK